MEKNYFTIKETAAETGLPDYTIRYWENKFGAIKPVRLSSGHRRYTRKDLETIKLIKDLVFIKGYTISGARKHLASLSKNKAENKTANIQDSDRPGSRRKNKLLTEISQEIKSLLSELENI